MNDVKVQTEYGTDSSYTYNNTWNNKRKIHVLAVHIAKSICIESKKKNMTSKDIEAPKGRHKAWIVSRVWTSAKKQIHK